MQMFCHVKFADIVQRDILVHCVVHCEQTRLLTAEEEGDGNLEVEIHEPVVHSASIQKKDHGMNHLGVGVKHVLMNQQNT